MHPYRPLWIADPDERAPRDELRGLAVVLVGLGLLRLVPAITLWEPVGLETGLAALMAIAGAHLLARRGVAA